MLGEGNFSSTRGNRMLFHPDGSLLREMTKYSKEPWLYTSYCNTTSSYLAFFWIMLLLRGFTGLQL